MAPLYQNYGWPQGNGVLRSGQVLPNLRLWPELNFSKNKKKRFMNILNEAGNF
jgi:hypothetical protein